MIDDPIFPYIDKEDTKPARLDEKQIGGDHYKKHAFTPWEIIDEYKLDFYAGNALKYILRAKEKNGLEDLKKAKHYIEKMISNMEKELAIKLTTQPEEYVIAKSACLPTPHVHPDGRCPISFGQPRNKP